MRFYAFSNPTRRWRKPVMMQKLENPQPDLFEPGEPRAVLAPAQKIQLAALIEALLLEIAAALAGGEVGDDQDHG